MASCASPAAKLKHRVLLQSCTQVEDGQGGYLDEWGTVATLWANVEPASSFEQMRAMQLGNTVTHKVLVRYRGGLTVANRLVFRGRVLHIVGAVNEHEQNRWLKLTCKETADIFVAPVPAGFVEFILPDGLDFALPDGSLFTIPSTGAEPILDQFLLPDGSIFALPDGNQFAWS